MLTSATRGEMLTPILNPNECNSTLTSGASGGGGAEPPPISYILGEGVNYLTLRVQFYFYANEWK